MMIDNLRLERQSSTMVHWLSRGRHGGRSPKHKFDLVPGHVGHTNLGVVVRVPNHGGRGH